MLTDLDWNELERVLRGCERVTDKECAYLKGAFVATKRMWAGRGRQDLGIAGAVAARMGTAVRHAMEPKRSGEDG